MKTNRALASFLSLAALASPIPATADDLAEIYGLAVENDPQIVQARAQYNADHTRLAQGRSQLLPSITLNGTSSRNTNAARDIHDFSHGYNAHGYSINLSQNVLNFESWYAFQAARDTDRLALTNLAIAEQGLILRVATAYFDVLRSLDSLASFQAEEEAARQVLTQTQQRFDVGLSAITDVYDAQASYDLARVNRLVEENNLSQRYEALEAITGRPHRNLETLSDEFPIEIPEPNVLADWVALAEDNNLQIQAAEYVLEARQDDARSAKAAMLPSLTLQASYRDSAAVTNPFTFFPGTPNTNSSIGLQLSIPLYRGGANQARMRQAYYTRDASEGALLETRRNSIQAARNSYRSVETDVLAVQARQQAIVSAQSSLDANEVGAEVGTRNVVDVVLAQRTLFQAMRDYANARYNYVIDSLTLKQAGGVLSPQDVLDLNEWLE